MSSRIIGAVLAVGALGLLGYLWYSGLITPPPPSGQKSISVSGITLTGG